MRKLSYLFLALAGLSPIVTLWLVQRERRIYAAKFGEAPEGIGLFAMMAAGTVVMFAMSVVSTYFAIRSFRALAPPRALGRKIELALLCLPALAVALWTCVGLLGLPHHAPPVIHTN